MVVIFFSGIVTEKLNDLPATLMYIIYVNVVGHIQKKMYYSGMWTSWEEGLWS